MAPPRFLRIQCTLIAVAVAGAGIVLGTGCGGPGRPSVRASLAQPTPDRTVDAVVRGLVTVTPILQATPTVEAPPLEIATEPTAANESPDSDSTEVIAGSVNPEPVPTRAKAEVRITDPSDEVASARSEPTTEAIDSEASNGQTAAEDGSNDASKQPPKQRPSKRTPSGGKARPTATPEVQLNAAANDSPEQVPASGDD